MMFYVASNLVINNILFPILIYIPFNFFFSFFIISLISIFSYSLNFILYHIFRPFFHFNYVSNSQLIVNTHSYILNQQTNNIYTRHNPPFILIALLFFCLFIVCKYFLIVYEPLIDVIFCNKCFWDYCLLDIYNFDCGPCYKEQYHQLLQFFFFILLSDTLYQSLCIHINNKKEYTSHFTIYCEYVSN